MALSLGMASCDVLDVTPIDPGTVMKVDANGLMNKCYANMAIAGQQGPDDGDCDVDGSTAVLQVSYASCGMPTNFQPMRLCAAGVTTVSARSTSTSTQVRTQCCRASTIAFIRVSTTAITILRSVPTTMPQ